MSLKIIHTNERKPYRSQYHPFIDEHFPKDFVGGTFPSWSDSPFLFANIGLENGTIESYVSFLITSEKTYQKVLSGQIKEHEIEPYTPGSFETAYLYWPVFILKNRQHGAYLIKSIFREVETTCRDWELSISHVYSIAFTKFSERLMRRYYFTQAGTYGGKYPIMTAKVSENPYLRAFLP
jgi:hypothetical protein